MARRYHDGGAGCYAAAMEWAGFTLNRTLVMGILNVTPDSFSDGGSHADAGAAIAAGLKLLAAGADILDVGGESTRPGAAEVPPAQEIARIVPVVAALAQAGAVVSIDTRHAATMAAALDAGARIVNDVSALAHDPKAATLVAARRCPVVLMHMRGTPETMNGLARYDDVVAEVAAEILIRRDVAVAAGIEARAIALDPGFGFAKTGAQNLALLRGTRRLAALGHPLLIGLSRKRFLAAPGGDVPEHRLGASLAAGLYAARHGADILRVHDVAETVQALRLEERLTEDDDGHCP